jgi:hypothetical protein
MQCADDDDYVEQELGYKKKFAACRRSEIVNLHLRSSRQMIKQKTLAYKDPNQRRCFFQRFFAKTGKNSVSHFISR